MQVFRKPLNAGEESRLLAQMHAGDAASRELLIEHNLRLVAHIVKKYNLPEGDFDDYISIGTIGLIKAIDTFDAGKGIRLATYASRCIDNELLMMFRSSKKQAREVSLSDPIGSDKEGNEITLYDVLETTTDYFDDLFLTGTDRQKLRGFIDNALTAREREIILLRYGLYGHREQTQREIADSMNISRSYVSRIEKRALKKLRECYEATSPRRD